MPTTQPHEPPRREEVIDPDAVPEPAEPTEPDEDDEEADDAG